MFSFLAAVLTVSILAGTAREQEPAPKPAPGPAPPVPFVRPDPPQPLPFKVRLPKLPVVPAPVPVPSPTGTISLSGDQLYVVDSNTELIIKTWPEGVLSIEEDIGPLKVRGLFVDSATPGKTETKVFAGPYIYTISAAATGEVGLFIVPVGVQAATDIIEVSFDASVGPPIPPKPPVPPVPPVPPGPPPVPATTVLYVTMLTDVNAPTVAISSVTANPELDAALKAANCVVRKWDATSPEAVKAGYPSMLNKLGGPPALIIQPSGIATPVIPPQKLPATADEVKAIVTQLRKAA